MNGDRITNQFLSTMENQVVKLYAQIEFGATGAVAKFQGGGIADVVRDDVGEYHIVTEDKYNKILGVSLTHCFDGAPAATSFIIGEHLPVLEVSYKSDKKIPFFSLSEAGVLVNPDADSSLLVELTFRKSSYGPYDK
jgi:hypothetical protein